MLTKEDQNYVLDSVVWFAKRVVFGNYLCDVICFKLSRKADCKNDLVLESECLYLKDVLINTITNFDLNCIRCCNHVLLEIRNVLTPQVEKTCISSNSKKLSPLAKTLKRATEGSVG